MSLNLFYAIAAILNDFNVNKNNFYIKSCCCKNHKAVV
jgi:hypothetical protein